MSVVVKKVEDSAICVLNVTNSLLKIHFCTGPRTVGAYIINDPRVGASAEDSSGRSPTRRGRPVSKGLEW